jgi:hypothetical protein
MKHLLIFISFVLLFFSTGKINAQCNVSKAISDDGISVFSAASEKIYSNEDFEYGILVAYAQIVVWQHPTNKEYLQFFLHVRVGYKGGKTMVVPRSISCRFSDGSSLDLIAEELRSPEYLAGIYTQVGVFRLKTDQYSIIQTKSISSIKISDTRTSNALTCNPFKDLLKEQANCIALQL